MAKSMLGKWLRLPSRIALLLGLGAVSAAGAGADTGEAPAQAQNPGHSASIAGPVIRSEAGRLYLSENGGEFRELRLPDGAEARQLLRLLDQADGTSSGVPLRPMLMAGDGGAGFHWTPAGQASEPDGRATVGNADQRSQSKVPAVERRDEPQNAPRRSRIGERGANG